MLAVTYQSNRESPWHRVLRALTRTGLLGIVTLALITLFAAVPVQAQGVRIERSSDSATERPRRDATDARPSPDNTLNFSRAAAKPPLPLRAPVVGPVLKASSWEWNAVEKWTTAFLPDPAKHNPDFKIPDEERWIHVDLSTQTLVAYERDRPIRAFIISSGLPNTPTVVGEFRIGTKVRAQTMDGGDPELGNDYFLPNVEWVQYFFQDYGLHGTYWHQDFGQPKSHGCVNMTNTDAKWLFDWAGPVWDGESVWQKSTPDNPGTLVIVEE